MGWNRWDCYGTTVTEEEEVLANAPFMAEHLLPFGWDTVVVDIQWYEPPARAGGYNEGFGSQLPASTGSPRQRAASASNPWRTGSTAWGSSSGCTSCGAYPGLSPGATP